MSYRSLNGELSHLIEEGLARPEYESLITEAANRASMKATQGMVRAFSQALEQTLKGTPEGLAMLKAVAASLPNPQNATSTLKNLEQAWKALLRQDGEK